jgi:hypothetical protein
MVDGSDISQLKHSACTLLYLQRAYSLLIPPRMTNEVLSTLIYDLVANIFHVPTKKDITLLVIQNELLE